jgi:hypothetical protein
MTMPRQRPTKMVATLGRARSTVEMTRSRVLEGFDQPRRGAREEEFVQGGENILISAGTRFGAPGATNLLGMAQA